MATIGTFTKIDGGEYVGEIRTLRLNLRGVHIQAVSRTNDKAPSHRIYFGRVELGAAWAKKSEEGREYLSVKLDDPSLNAPIYANLFDDEGHEEDETKTASLIWSRPERRSGD